MQQLRSIDSTSFKTSPTYNHRLLSLLVFIILTSYISACGNANPNKVITDSAGSSSGVDSMPVVKPPVTDSNSVIITAPVNDSNVKVPDTSGLKR
ncbi:MAG TPA: hypothetical protein PKM63_19325 [Panacibacter sp.]|nr:hypothetical protein [Panacibacter sp.]HNP46455.1 hypothetical protein [Panacibacter sp.]